jgi:hypothetical protein
LRNSVISVKNLVNSALPREAEHPIVPVAHSF